jgi:hypothetical protein
MRSYQGLERRTGLGGTNTHERKSTSVRVVEDNIVREKRHCRLHFTSANCLEPAAVSEDLIGRLCVD